MAKVEKIHNMKLHEVIIIRAKTQNKQDIQTIQITRIPGGWLYRFYLSGGFSASGFHSPVFVPYNDEFLETNKG